MLGTESLYLQTKHWIIINVTKNLENYEKGFTITNHVSNNSQLYSNIFQPSHHLNLINKAK